MGRTGVTEQVLYLRGDQPEKLAEKVLLELRRLERVRA